MTASLSADARLPWRGTFARQKDSQSGRSPAARTFACDRQGVLLRPDGEKARAVKARYVRLCRGCGAYTPPRKGPGRRLRVLQAVPYRSDRAKTDPCARSRRNGEWHHRYGRHPSSYDLSTTQGRQRGGEALNRPLGGERPAVTVGTVLFRSSPGAAADGARWLRPRRDHRFGILARSDSWSCAVERASACDYGFW